MSCNHCNLCAYHCNRGAAICMDGMRMGRYKYKMTQKKNESLRQFGIWWPTQKDTPFHLFWWGFIITFTFLDCDLPVAVWRIRRTEEPPAGKADMSPAGVRDPITNLHIQAPGWWWRIMIMVWRGNVFVAMFVITMMIRGDHDDGRDIDDQNEEKTSKKELWQKI